MHIYFCKYKTGYDRSQKPLAVDFAFNMTMSM
jgi:hypothetical protein